MCCLIKKGDVHTRLISTVFQQSCNQNLEIYSLIAIGCHGW